jgi:F-type H+-transporting ATPase subunit epsilon
MDQDSHSHARRLQVVIVTPEATVRDQAARFVALPLYDGELGVAPGHSPMIGRLGYGELRIVAAEGPAERYYVGGGFVEVAGDQVSVLTNRAVPAEDIDAEVAQRQLDAALSRAAHSDELIAIRDRHAAEARAQIRLARRTAGGGVD